MLFASVMPNSTTDPIVEDSILNFDGVLLSKVLIAPVAVNVTVWGFGAPYSTGYRNCFSAVKLCDEVMVKTLWQLLFCKKFAPIINDSGNVAQAEYKPK